MNNEQIIEDIEDKIIVTTVLLDKANNEDDDDSRQRMEARIAEYNKLLTSYQNM